MLKLYFIFILFIFIVSTEISNKIRMKIINLVILAFEFRLISFYFQ